jgi:hypothetical protein
MAIQERSNSTMDTPGLIIHEIESQQWGAKKHSTKVDGKWGEVARVPFCH